MPSERKNPGALAGASGDIRKIGGETNQSATHNCSMQDRPSKRNKAATIFAWLGAIKRDVRLKSVDSRSALDIIEWLDDDFECFRAAKNLAEAIHVVESTAEASLARLRQYGYLIKIKKGKAPTSSEGGRKANDYRIEIPAQQAEVFPKKSGKTGVKVSPEKLGKTSRFKRTVSPEKSGAVSPEKLGAILENEPLDGGRALGRASASTYEAYVIDDFVDTRLEQNTGRAPEGAPGLTRHLADTDAKCGPVAPDAPPPTSDLDPCEDPDAWRSEADFNSDTRLDQYAGRAPGFDRPHADDIEVPDPHSFENDPFDDPAEPMHQSDWDDYSAGHDQALSVAVEAFEEIYLASDVDFHRHAEDAVDALGGCIPEAMVRFTRQLDFLEAAIPHCRRAAIFEMHCDVLLDLIARTSGGKEHAKRVITKFVHDRQTVEVSRHG